MSRASIQEVAQDRLNDAAHFGLLPSNVARRKKVHTGLETTQDINKEPPRPLSESQQGDLLRRAREKENIRAYLRNTLRSPVFTNIPIQIPDQNAIDCEPEPHRVVVVVERVIHKALVGGTREIWLKIWKRNNMRLSQRIPTFLDRQVFTAKYPLFFFEWSSAPSSIECLAEWKNDEWSLVNIFEPYA